MIDSDHFKRFNYIHGHQRGEESLHRVRSEVTTRLRCDDDLCRYRGEGFAPPPPATDAATAHAVGERIRRHLARTPSVLDNGEQTVTLSIDIAHDADSARIHRLIDRADRLAHRAKHAGRNCTRQGST